VKLLGEPKREREGWEEGRREGGKEVWVKSEGRRME